jgi:hypothetical protein
MLTPITCSEWETGQDLAKLRARTPKGHPLDASQRMPLLIVPLTIKSCFILIYETFMTVCQGLLEGSPTFQDFNHIMDPPTQYYHGKGIPLWTSWTRPIRRESFRTTRDDIYVVREDGVIKFLELDSKLEEIVQADMKIGELAGNCGTALASLDYHTYGSQSGDMLITGGDSCSGGTYLVRIPLSLTCGGHKKRYWLLRLLNVLHGLVHLKCVLFLTPTVIFLVFFWLSNTPVDTSTEGALFHRANPQLVSSSRFRDYTSR